MVFCVVMQPIQNLIYGRIRNKVFAYLATVGVGMVVLLCLYGIVGLFGFGVWK